MIIHENELNYKEKEMSCTMRVPRHKLKIANLRQPNLISGTLCISRKAQKYSHKNNALLKDFLSRL